MMYTPAILNWFPWPKKPEPPAQPNYAQAIADLQRGQARSDSVIDALRSELATARQELGNMQRYADMLNGITARQDAELANISYALSATQEQLKLSVEDKQYQALQIKGLQVEVAELRVQLAASNEARAMSDQKRTALQLALDQSEKENRQLRADVAALRGG